MLKFKKLIFSIFFYLSISTYLTFFCSNQVNASNKVDEFIASEMQKKKIPGMSIAILKAGEIVKMQSYGLANIELNVPVTSNTVFQSGSIGKQFTATLIMMLVEQGKLKLTDKISQYIKDAPKKWENITIYHLLTHTSGLKNYNFNDNSMGLNFRNDYTDDELIRMAASMPLEFKAGEKWEYSNAGYVMLGMIIKKSHRKTLGPVCCRIYF